MDKKACDLKKIATDINLAKKDDDQKNTNKAVNFFLGDLESYALRGKFKRNTSCLISRGDGKFFCQTETGGKGFIVNDINLVKEKIESLGFVVEFEERLYYSYFNIRWG
jgi:hypothetical protein